MNYPIFLPYADKVWAMSTERQGGYSQGNYSGMNLCDYTGDNEQTVLKNRQLFCSQYNIELKQLILPRQTHSSEILHINPSFLSEQSEEQVAKLQGVDALITNVPKICLGIQTADCVPILLYDPIENAIGVVHCGWRGTVARLAAKTVLEMNSCFGSKPKNMVVAMGPSISVDAYEVGEELMDWFEKEKFPIGLFFKRNADTLRFHLNLPLANQWQLHQIGVPKEQIAQSNVCSFFNVEHYFSARRLGINSGRTLSAIRLL